MPSRRCDHCGLPVAAGRAAATGPVYCCYGCALVARLLGPQDQQSWGTWNIIRLGIGAFLAMDVMTVSLLLYTGAVEADAAAMFRWILLGLATPAMAILAYPFAAGALGELRRRRLSLDALIAVGSLAAYGASAAATIHGSGYIYYDTATMLPALVTFGKIIESAAKTRAAALLQSLQSLLPATALRRDAAGLHETPLAELRAGDTLVVRAGERFAADGLIREGSTVIEEAAFSGEFLPRLAGVGEPVLAGTVNGPGVVAIEATAVGEDLLLRRIVTMVQEAQLRPSHLQRLAARAANVLTPAVLILAAATGASWLLAGDARHAAMAALAVLVVACPCAMGIAAPLATSLAIARAARAGVIVRGGDVLENVARLDTLFVDKTGTVTTANPVVQSVETLRASDEGDVLGALATLESLSEHTLAKAIVGEALRRGLALGQAHGVQIFPGRGIGGLVTRDGKTRRVQAGSSAMFAGTQPSTDDNATVIHVAIDGEPRGRVTLTDSLRPDAVEAIAQLRGLDVRTVLLSGDALAPSRAAAAQLGIDHVEAPRLPQEKIARLDAARGEGLVIGMAGDGINDAPSLAAADVGLAMGAGSELARQAGNVVLLGNRLTQIPWLVTLGRRTRAIIKQNLAWAIGYNAIALAAAAAGWLHPLLAAAAMTVSSLTVLGNSLKIQGFQEEGNEGPGTRVQGKDTPSLGP